MTPERFQQIEELYHAAREGSGAERVALLSQADPELRREVESLLAVRTGGEFMDRPAVQNAPQLLEDLTGIEWTAGARLGPYQIESKLGGGGMGQVFRAVDTRLGRAVAIKITYQQFSSRFEREARAISSLNHPNICILHDVGPNYLVMELVEGETLAARLKQGPLSIEMVRHYGGQIAAALAEAHAKGIVHRDLKPGNIMIAKSTVKVLDFGLAKAGEDQTLTTSRMVMGTPVYMSPEQREGKPTDARTDIYSFGCVLYEMSTGARIGSQRRRLPSPKLEKIVSRCVQEDPADRWQSVAALEPELASLSPAAGPWKRIVAGAAALGAVSAGAWFYLHRPPKLADKDTVVLADFANSTGDPVFDGTLRQGLSIQLEQSPFLSITSDQRIQQTLKMMGQPADAKLTPAIARELCQRTGSAAVLDGSIAQIGTGYLLTLRAVNSSSGESLASTEAQASDKNHVLGALGKTASEMRNKLGESLSTVQKFDTPLEQATTPSLEALKAYSLGRKAMLGSEFAAAVPFFQRAIRLDPNFAMAHARLGTCYLLLGEPTLASENTRKAYELRESVSELEKFYIESHYYQQTTGELEKARQVYELWAQSYPRDWARAAAQTTVSALSGQHDEGLVESREELRLNPVAEGYVDLLNSYLRLNRLEEAQSAVEETQAKKFDSPFLRAILYKLCFLQNDAAGMSQQVAWAAGRPGAEDALLGLETETSAYSGRLGRARDLSRQAVVSAKRAGEPELAAGYEADAALREALFGNPAQARERAGEALDLSNSADVQSLSALALSIAGDAVRAETLADALDNRFPEHTIVQSYYHPTLRAQLALSRNDPSRAIEVLQAAAPYELSSSGALYPVYVRGESYLAAHRGNEAAAEFQKILDHRGIVVNAPIGALAHLGLGRAYALSGDKTGAKIAYQDFLTLWKDADPDIPILKQARVEYAELR